MQNWNRITEASGQMYGRAIVEYGSRAIKISLDCPKQLESQYNNLHHCNL